MTPHINAPVSDETLTALIDGELETIHARQVQLQIDANPALAARLAWLRQGGLTPLTEAFDDLLCQAPQTRLASMLAALPEPPAAPARVTGIGRRQLVAAAAGLFAFGVLADRAWLGWLARARLNQDNWREQVADYMALYTRSTLEQLPVDAASQRAQLAIVSERLALALTLESVQLPGLTLKRAQLLQYDGQPIAQLAYQDTSHDPLALCITPREGEAGLAHERRQGLNLVHWATHRHAFLLIGRSPPASLETMAILIRTRLQA
ncbi:transcriptional regulator [Pseudomonas sp. R5(2019)]|uniref:transcriptional regulator n=1 Tax=Pseudomonas sp. R5(2019) TaxID=2697566 RepID=UPI0014129D38|nr:transcriptional regulator [Pseudomonas sp. R5(2019)]NBA96338.1 transcriptional regulator [Pseudomonas sp. R5(2019)]